MSELLSTVRIIATVLGVWALVSIVAVVPVVGFLRLQAVANEARARAARRQDWREVARPG